MYSAVLCLSGAIGASAQNSQDVPVYDNSAGSQQQIAPSKPSATIPSRQGGGADTTLEISPQTGGVPPSGTSADIPSNREFRPGQDEASVDRNFRPGEQDLGQNGGGRGASNNTSCIGLRVNYTSMCFKGAEEHGLEVTSVDSNGPAQQAGLRPAGNKGGILAAAETAGALLGPVQVLTNRLMEDAALANRGDLIVAVDDQRVRSQADLNDAIAKAKPGDTLYLTVLRPLPHHNHQELKIAVTVGKWQSGDADTCSAMTTASSSQPRAPE